MYLASLAGVAGFAALGQAVLVPPTLSSTAASAEAVPFEHNIEIETRSFVIDCPGCSVLLPDAAGVKHDVVNLQSQLLMNFSIAHEDGIDRLLLNDAHIYPNDRSMIALFDPLTAPQLVQSPLDPDRWENVAQPVIGYRMRIDRPHVSNNELDLVVLEFQIIEVGGRFVEGMSKFDIRLLETPSEKLMIGDIRYSLPVPEHSMPGKEGKQCHSRLCRWKEIVAGKLPKAKGCGRKSGRPHHLHNGEHSSHRNHGHHRPQGHRGHHGYYERHQTFIRFVKGIALHVLIPIAIGIVVGMTASMVGFVAATFIVFLWRLLFRRNRAAAYAQVPQEETTTEESEKSKIVFQEEEHIDAPPVYEEAVELKA